MTMHLARGLTTTNTKKRKRKITKVKLERWQKELRVHNKHMKKLGMHDHIMSMEEYIEYIHGNYKPKRDISGVVNLPWHSEGYRRETESIPSAKTEYSFSPCVKKAPQEYTGERKLVGIATMHKSNMVPVFADEDDHNGSKAATEIAKMRRN